MGRKGEGEWPGGGEIARRHPYNYTKHIARRHPASSASTNPIYIHQHIASTIELDLPPAHHLGQRHAAAAVYTLSL